MNVIYESKKYLPVYDVKDIEKEDFSVFFSSHKRSVIYVINDNDNLVGYINHSLYRGCNNDNFEGKVLPFEYIVDIQEIPALNLDSLLSETTQIDAVPVLDEGKFVGALVRSYSEELVAFDRLMNQIALGILECFKELVITFLKSIGVEIISFIGSDEDYCHFKDILGLSFSILPVGNTTGQLIIDVEHSKSYRIRECSQDASQILSMEELMTLSLIPFMKNFAQDNGLFFHCYEGLIAEKIENCFSHCLLDGSSKNVAEAIASAFVCEKFSAGNKKVKDFLTDPDLSPLNENYVISNGVNLIMAVPNRGQKQTDNNAVFFYGSCLTYGLCVPEELSIPSLVRNIIKNTGFDVVNNGVKNGHSLLNDFLFILSTSFRHGDHIVIINAFSDRIRESLTAVFDVMELSGVMNDNDDKAWFFLDNTFHINHIANEIIAKAITRSLNLDTNSTINISQKNVAFFDKCNSRRKIASKFVIEKGLLGTYREYLLSHKKIGYNGTNIGAVLLTANPITLGHEHLISYARRHCDVLYVFIVEEDGFMFNTVERMLLTYSVISDPNIIIVSTGNLMTAKFTFPEYFSKEKCDYKLSPQNLSDIHCNIFGSFVCPLLGITKRFVAEENKGSVTDIYNKKLFSVLPKYGVEVVLIPRLKLFNNSVISSSKVRSLIRNKEWEDLPFFVSKPVEEYIKSKWKKGN